MFCVMKHDSRFVVGLTLVSVHNDHDSASEAMMNAQADAFYEIDHQYKSEVYGGGGSDEASVSWGGNVIKFYVIEIPNSAPPKADKYLIEISEQYSRQVIISDQPSADAALELVEKLYSYENGSIEQLGERDFEGETNFKIVKAISVGDPDYDEYAGYPHFNEEGEMP